MVQVWSVFHVIFWLLGSSSLSHGFIGNNIFQTGDSFLFDPFCVADSAELLEIGDSTFTHEAITTSALKRSISTLFQELNPDYQPLDLEATSLSQLFQSVSLGILSTHWGKNPQLIQKFTF